MRREDIKLLSVPYETSENDVDWRIARRLGVYSAPLRVLEDAIFDDLDETTFGIGWWANTSSTSRRIVISDYLWQCCHSAQENLVEAKIHLLDAGGAWEREHAVLAGSVVDDGGPLLRFEPPRPRSPLDEVDHLRSRANLAGAVRAVASTIDVIAALQVGVTGLATKIATTSPTRVRDVLKKADGTTPGGQFQLRVAADLDAALANSGPDAWCDWVLRYGTCCFTAVVARS